MDRYPHCGHVVDSVGLEIDSGRRIVMIIHHFKGKTIDLWVDNARLHKGIRAEGFICRPIVLG